MLQREQADLDHEMKTIQEKHVGSTHIPNPRYIAPPEDRKLAVRHLKNRIELLKVDCPSPSGPPGVEVSARSSAFNSWPLLSSCMPAIFTK